MLVPLTHTAVLSAHLYCSTASTSVTVLPAGQTMRWQQQIPCNINTSRQRETCKSEWIDELHV